MFYINSKKNGKWGIKDTKDGVEEFYSTDQIRKVEQQIKIYGVSTQGITIVRKVPRDFEYFAGFFMQFMRRHGCDMGFGDERICKFNGEDTLEVRFVMGMGSWRNSDGEDDICDADYLDRKASKKLRETCLEFYKETGILPMYQLGEKAWCYFTFH